jgi:AcrR family transcriptional regulator
MAPRSQSKSAEIRQETKKKIAKAAFDLIAQRGFETTSVDDIAKAAGVSKGLIYNYYKSKEHLLQELVTESLHEGEDVLPSIIGNPDPQVVLENIIRWFFNQLRERPEQWRLMTEVTLRLDRYPFMHDIIMATMQGYVDILRGIFLQLGYKDPLGEARILAALFDGVGIQAVVVRQGFPLDEVEKVMLIKYQRDHHHDRD